ncbi:MAG TPA: hypothetical protein VHI13_21000 [Candidatus Kapabacteria bacterium]|nr:hypothetical protein [Candidatus Kapabacteria bacterium]
MLSRAYLILSPATPNDIGAAVLNQRQTIPLAWAFALASPNTSLNVAEDHVYFSTTVGDALGVLDRGIAAWSYNSYFRDTLGPVGVFRDWLAAYPADARMYVNITDLIKRSPNAKQDIEELKRIAEKVNVAFEEAEVKHFTNFVQELRKLSYPLVTVPITGDREVDIEILSFEIRDTDSVEAEMALQIVGSDRTGELLDKATASINLRKGKLAATVPQPAITKAAGLALFTSHLDEARELLVEELGCVLLRETKNRLVLNAHGREFIVVKLEEDHAVKPEEE